MMHFKFSALPNVCVLLYWNDKFEHSPQIFRHIFISGNYMRVQPGHDLNPLTYLDGYLQCSQMGSIWHYKVNTSTVFKVWHLHFHEQLRLLMSSKMQCSEKECESLQPPLIIFHLKILHSGPHIDKMKRLCKILANLLKKQNKSITCIKYMLPWHS